MLLPITPMVRPSTLAKASNGNLDRSLLTRIQLDDGVSAVLETNAAKAFEAMFEAARRDIPGLKIKHVGDYRTFAQQVRLFTERYAPVNLTAYLKAGSRRRYWSKGPEYGYSSRYWVLRSGMASAAVPGTSNHGWGLALDVAEENDADPFADPVSAALISWMVRNASRFGISAELQSEPWHWRYVAGDQPTPPPPNQTENIVNQLPTLRLNSTERDHVRRLQALLNTHGSKLVEDGYFGPATESAVRNFQTIKRLTPDGVVGRAQTWPALLGVL